VKATFRPLPAWPYPEQPTRPATYRVDYARTLRDLEYEIDAIDGSELVIGIVASERDVRIDGALRAGARVGYPGVEVSFDVPDGRRLVFHTDVHKGYVESWKDNLRAIALGLEALRAVARYGITSGVGQQYAGFAQLAAGGPDPEHGRVLVERAGSLREALRRHHPDNGGQQADFVDVVAYRDLAKVPA
jgi:hypothetical protein